MFVLPVPPPPQVSTARQAQVSVRETCRPFPRGRPAGDKRLFEGRTESVSERQLLDLPRILPGPACLPVVFVKSLSLDRRGRRRTWGLSEQLSDLSVDVAKEVHVGGSAVQTFVLHQELTEQHLGFVFLPHDLELRGEPKGDKPLPSFFNTTSHIISKVCPANSPKSQTAAKYLIFRSWNQQKRSSSAADSHKCCVPVRCEV